MAVSFNENGGAGLQKIDNDAAGLLRKGGRSELGYAASWGKQIWPGGPHRNFPEVFAQNGIGLLAKTEQRPQTQESGK